MGTYSDTAPYQCPKSARILDHALKVLEKKPLAGQWGSVNALALLACGRPEYLPRVQTFARSLADEEVRRKRDGNQGTWSHAYQGIFLSEYYLQTGDKEVFPAIESIAVKLARGQGRYGTFGHGFRDHAPGKALHGPVPPYGPVNQAGLAAVVAMVLGGKCGVRHPALEPAIERAGRFFAYFVDKGGIPYGEHPPYHFHENNGVSALAAVMYGIQGNRWVDETRYFARMATAGFVNRECGHTGQGFSYLWSAMGAHVGGPDAAAAFAKEVQWHLDLVRRSDGSFTYDGGEQYGPGKTDDDTYFGRSSYYGISPDATYVLTYAMPLRKLYITGKEANRANMLSREEAASAIASGRFDLDRKGKSPDDLVASFRVRRAVGEGRQKYRYRETMAMIVETMELHRWGKRHRLGSGLKTLGSYGAAAKEVLPLLDKHGIRASRAWE